MRNPFKTLALRVRLVDVERKVERRFRSDEVWSLGRIAEAIESVARTQVERHQPPKPLPLLAQVGDQADAVSLVMADGGVMTGRLIAVDSAGWVLFRLADGEKRLNSAYIAAVGAVTSDVG